MATTKDQARAAILDRLTGFTRFHPANASLFADWSVEPGDVLRVENEGTIYDVPVYQMDMSWKGTPTVDVQSTGSKKRPDPSKLNKGSGYGGSRKKEEEEIEMIRHRADITKTNEKISLWATEEEWSTIADEYQEIHRTQFDLTAEGLTSTVTGIAGGNFDKTKAYAIGDVVMRNGKIYVFTSAHAANTDWNYSEVAEALNLYGSIKSHSTRITQTENAVGLVVYNGEIRAGQIMLAINGGTGHSEALIEADKVQINGTTTIGDTMTYANSNLYVKGDIYAMTPGGSYHALAGNMVVPGGCSLYFNNGSSGNVIVNATSMGQMLGSVMNVRIVETSTGSGVYRLEYKNIGDTSWTPDTTTFSRAVTPTITGAWDGGVYKVRADGTLVNTDENTLFDTGISASTISASGSDLVIGYNIGYATVSGGQQVRGGSTGKTGSVTISNALRSETVTPSNTRQTITPGTGKIGLSQVIVEAVPATTQINVTHAWATTGTAAGPTNRITSTGTATGAIAGSEAVWLALSVDTTNGTATVKDNSVSPAVAVLKESFTIPTPTLGSETFTSNDTYYASTYGYDGFSSVTVNVSSGTKRTATSVSVSPRYDGGHVVGSTWIVSYDDGKSTTITSTQAVPSSYHS